MHSYFFIEACASASVMKLQHGTRMNFFLIVSTTSPCLQPEYYVDHSLETSTLYRRRLSCQKNLLHITSYHFFIIFSVSHEHCVGIVHSAIRWNLVRTSRWAATPRHIATRSMELQLMQTEVPPIAQLEERETVMGYTIISRSLVRSRLEG